MRRMIAKSLPILALLAVVAGRSDAQFLFIGPGSTVPGDFARGEGIRLEGAGIYNYDTAVANAINTDTYIKWNEYIYNSMKNMERERSERVRAYEKGRNANYRAILERIGDNPDWRDLKQGDALNAKLAKIRDPKRIDPYNLRYRPIPLSTAEVRKIPFVSAKHGAEISMQRLLSRQSGWPIGLRKFAPSIRIYEKAMDAALEEMVVGKLSKEAINRIENARRDLRKKLDAEFAGKTEDRLYQEAFSHLFQLEKFHEKLKIVEVETIVKELDTYSGTTIADLVEFMNRRGLTFGIPREGDELELYPKLFASLDQQLEAVKNAPPREGGAR